MMEALQSKLLLSVPNLRHGFTHRKMQKQTVDTLATEIFFAKQVHTANFYWLDSKPSSIPEADAVATSLKEIPIGVKTADCIPILVAAINSENKGFAIAAIHAGWRGTDKKIAFVSIEKFSEFAQKQGRIHRLFATIGPCISAPNYEVGEDVAQHFSAKYLKPIKNKAGKFLLDLVSANVDQIHDQAKNLTLRLDLDILLQCTLSNPDLYPSYRRDGPQKDRILSYIALVA